MLSVFSIIFAVLKIEIIMKNYLSLMLLALSLIQCTTEEIEESVNLEVEYLSTETQIDIAEMLPNSELDTSFKGLYQGTIVSEDLSFHERVTINLENDGNLSAIIFIEDSENIYFNGIQENATSYKFTSDIGYFILEKQENVIQVIEAKINNVNASLNYVKDLSHQRNMMSLGTFTNNGAITGTWDFTFTATNGLGFDITELTIVRDGGSSFLLDLAGRNGVYQRLCSGPGTTVPIGVLNSAFFNIQISVAENAAEPLLLAGAPLGFTFVANRLEGTNAGCLNAPSTNMNIVLSNWNWNGNAGTATIDTASLPTFID